MDPRGGTTTTGAAGGGGINREKMKEADKEMELRANRAKALLAERHIGLKTNQVSVWCVHSREWWHCIFICIHVVWFVPTNASSYEISSKLQHNTTYRLHVTKGRCTLKHK